MRKLEDNFLQPLKRFSKYDIESFTDIQDHSVLLMKYLEEVDGEISSKHPNEINFEYSKARCIEMCDEIKYWLKKIKL